MEAELHPAPPEALAPDPAQRRAATVPWWPVLATFAALVATSLLALWFVRHRGVDPGSDESTYLDAAYALGRLHTWNLARAVTTAFAHSVNGAPSQQLLAVMRHGMTFSDKPLGLSALLAIPVAIHPTLLSANFGLIVGLSALSTWLGLEVARWIGSSRVAGAGIGLLFVTPSFLLATTQVYPDLLSGLVLALIVVRLAWVETDVAQGRGSYLLTGLLLGGFTWLDEKNLVVGLLLALALYYLMRRRGAPTSDLGWALIPVAAGVAALIAYNFYAFGRIAGPAQALEPLSATMFTKFAALLIGHRHGLFVQCPVAVLGIVGAVAFARRARVTAVAAAVVTVAILAGNASVAGGMGGGSLVGRYQWEVMPLFIAGAGIYLASLWPSRRRALAVLVAILAVVTTFESVEVWRSRPTPSSFTTTTWDPAYHPGWWGRLDPTPDLNRFFREWSSARTLWGVAFVLLTVGAIVLALPRLGSPRRRGARVAASTLAAGAAATGALAILSPFLLPQPITYVASDLGPLPFPLSGASVTVSGPPRPAPVLFGPRLDVLPGTYTASLDYSLTTASTSAVSASVSLSTLHGTRTLAEVSLAPGRLHRQTIVARVSGDGDFDVAVRWHGPGTLVVRSVTIAKVATCNVEACRGGLF